MEHFSRSFEREIVHKRRKEIFTPLLHDPWYGTDLLMI